VRPAGTAPYPRPLAHSQHPGGSHCGQATVYRASRAPTTEDQDHPHACLNGCVYLGYTTVDEETGEEVEQVEAMPCRRCLGNS
jgi:hypothetical protein